MFYIVCECSTKYKRNNKIKKTGLELIETSFHTIIIDKIKVQIGIQETNGN